MMPVSKPVSPDGIESWLVSYLADLLDIPHEQIDVTVPFEEFGLDSAAAVALTFDLEKWLGVELDPNLIGYCPDIRSVARHIADNHGGRAGD